MHFAAGFRMCGSRFPPSTPPVSKLVEEDGRPVNIDLGDIRLYPDAAPDWTARAAQGLLRGSRPGRILQSVALQHLASVLRRVARNRPLLRGEYRKARRRLSGGRYRLRLPVRNRARLPCRGIHPPKGRLPHHPDRAVRRISGPFHGRRRLVERFSATRGARGSTCIFLIGLPPAEIVRGIENVVMARGFDVPRRLLRLCALFRPGR